MPAYEASCHCRAVRLTLTSEPITRGMRCNCSICIRRGAVMSASYVAASAVVVEGRDHLGLYQFGDHAMNHYFCTTCGVAPFSTVAALPPGYRGAAKVGDYRINLGCIADLDVLALEIQIVDGRSS